MPHRKTFLICKDDPSRLQEIERAFEISFAPSGEGSISHGAVFIMWNGSRM